MTSRPSFFLLLSAFFALYVIWASTYLVIQIGVESWPPLLMTGWRFVLAGALMFFWVRWHKAPLPTMLEVRNAGIVGILLLACGNGGVTLAESIGVSSGISALSIATVPLFALLFGLYWGMRHRLMEWVGILLGILGMLLLNFGGTLQASHSGATLLLFAAAAWAFGSIWSKQVALPDGTMNSAIQMLVAGAVLVLSGFLSGERLHHWPTPAGWLAFFYLVFFSSIIGFSAYLYLLKTVRPALATSYAYVNPPIAILLGIVFAQEQIDRQEALAMLIIICAVVLIVLPKKSA